jgi:prevent-host-death family protein
MKTVRIAELKAHLSEHLRLVRSGTSMTVLDRDTPIARLVPYETAPERLVIRRRTSARSLSDVRFPATGPRSDDVVNLLLEDRRAGR